jgi:diguanylate cyclase (GGDEF)-like protein/PAS domain S-box-containing protein
MSNFSPQEIEQALRECATEPIHQIGEIQPHGALLVLSADPQHRVLQSSDNLANFFAISSDQANGKPLALLFDEPSTMQIEQLIQKLGDKNTITGKVNIIQKQSSHDLQAHLYTSEGLLVLELEHDQDTQTEGDLARLLLDIQQTLLSIENDGDTSHYCDRIVEHVHELTGYDSVMAYRFDSNWDGEVISQSHVEDTPSFLGLRFPASDIPPQARRLYTQNLVRIVADIDAIPIPISPVLNPVSQQPLDMSYSALRSLSPIHIQYLRNMGIQASMVISLIQNGQLWGLIACHHRTAKPMSVAMREAAIFISRMASAKLALIESQDRLTQVEHTHTILSDLVNHITFDSIEAVLQRLLPRLLSLLNATGMIIVADGRRHIKGDVPEPSDIDDLLAWLDAQLQREVFSCDYLEQQFAPAHAYRAIVSGLLAISVTSDISNCIIWLRKEKPQTVHWAGSAEKGLVQDTAGNLQLTPRKSFEIWTETWRGRSSAWTGNEISIAQMLALALPKSLVQKYQLEQEQALRKSAEVTALTMRQQLEAMTAAVPGVVYQFLRTPAVELKFTYVSKGIQDLYEVTAEQACRDYNALTSCIIPEDRDYHRESMDRAALAFRVWEHEYRIRTPGGHIKWVHGLATPQRQADGGILWSGLMTDVSERKKNEAALQESELRFRSLANAAPVLIWVAEPDKSFSWFNNSWFEYTGRSIEQEFGNGWAEWIHPDDLNCCLGIYTSHFDARQPFQMEYRLRGKNNQYHWFIDVGKPRLDEHGQFLGYIGMLTDINERKITENTINQLAFHDPLTQLPNRRLLHERLQHSIKVERRDGKQLALLMLDLDRFKTVNDRLGHQAGDELLQQVAERLTARLRDVDMVARLGGDEFVVLLEDITQPEDAARVANEIIADLTNHFCLIQSDDIQIGVSIGISLYPQHGTSPEMLMDHADAALYQAKDAGRGCFAYFSEELTQAAQERIALELRLRNAIVQQQLRVFYQPQIDMISGRIVGLEALVRWQDPLNGLLAPHHFIAIAEESGLIVEISCWVLHEACRQGKQWLDEGFPHLTIAVNVSPQQLRRNDIGGLVAKVLAETGFPAKQLELEITESGLMENQKDAAAILKDLRAQGVRLAIDDFGTGYSSLSRLKHFPLDVLKIDKSFIDDIPFHQDDMEITATIIGMAHTLGLRVLAEGVETTAQLAFLQEKGCDMYQGYIRSQPVSAEEIAKLLDDQKQEKGV